MQREPIKKSTSRLIPVWFPESIIPILDDAVIVVDSDRSKFIPAVIGICPSKPSVGAGAI